MFDIFPLALNPSKGFDQASPRAPCRCSAKYRTRAGRKSSRDRATPYGQGALEASFQACGAYSIPQPENIRIAPSRHKARDRYAHSKAPADHDIPNADFSDHDSKYGNTSPS